VLSGVRAEMQRLVIGESVGSLTPRALMHCVVANSCVAPCVSDRRAEPIEHSIAREQPWSKCSPPALLSLAAAMIGPWTCHRHTSFLHQTQRHHTLGHIHVTHTCDFCKPARTQNASTLPHTLCRKGRKCSCSSISASLHLSLARSLDPPPLSVHPRPAQPDGHHSYHCGHSCAALIYRASLALTTCTSTNRHASA
jgi:hypothetical protein